MASLVVLLELSVMGGQMDRASATETVELSVMGGQMDRASATETVDLCSIFGRIKPITRKSANHSFPAGRSPIKRTV